jgi:Zn-dependent peptidase ImmA (M78 family)
MKTTINPSILTWARERNSLSIDELANLLQVDPALIREWENGGSVPSYAILESLAYQHLKLPLAVFYFPEPPDIDDPVKKFRRLPDYEFHRLSSSTLQIIRKAQAYQDSLYELLGVDATKKQIFKDLSGFRTLERLSDAARDYLGIPLEIQFSFGSSEQAFKAWRHGLEEAGVFAFKDTLSDRFISGFCLLDSTYPIILINNSNAFTRQMFTLAHELGHILLGVHGVTDVDEKYLDFMARDDKALEVSCNRFAAELLVPSVAFQTEIAHLRTIVIEDIEDLAMKFSVSREVILRRCLDYQLVSSDDYEKMAENWNKEYLRVPPKKPGGNYYFTKLAYLGEGFTRLAFEQYGRGRISKTELASHLNMNARNIDNLQHHLGW